MPCAFEEAFQIYNLYEGEMDDDVESHGEESTPKVLLTRDENLKIRNRWRESLFVKLCGKPMEYNLFIQKLHNLWKPVSEMTSVDVGFGFFNVTFQNREDRTRVQRDGPWFINYRFLAIRRWEPRFNPEKAALSTVALWIRMPQLPLEFYNQEILKKAADKIGPLPRIDGWTTTGMRANYARMCVQVNVNEPLPNHIRIGAWKQRIQYEGVQTLCFQCGVMGHKKENCPTSQIGGEIEQQRYTEGAPQKELLGNPNADKEKIEEEHNDRGP